MYDLSPYDFDQTDEGWSSLDKQGKYLEAAELIESYIAQNQQRIKTQDKVSIQTMYFHAGQEYAMAGNAYNDKAIENFKKSYKGKVDWDTYVDGTIAFLQRDKEGLRASADKLAELAQDDDRLETNTGLLKNYLNGLDVNASYAVIYDAPRLESIALRPTTDADKEFARNVHHQAYHDVVVRQFGKWDEPEQDAYFENTWSKYDSEIILWNGKPVGYWSVEHAPAEIHLHQFLILPEYQGRKIGSHLLNRLVELSSEVNVPIRLQVFRESDALKLYKRIGFGVVSMSNDHVRMEFMA